MTDAIGVARDQLRAFIERIERLEEEKKSIADDIKDVYGEAKGTGFDTKILRKVIAIRKQDRDERAEQEAILDSYLAALGMIEQPGFFDDEPRQAAPVDRQPAMALRSDGGLSIFTKHEDIRTSDGSPSVSSSLTTREAEESVVSTLPATANEACRASEEAAPVAGRPAEPANSLPTEGCGYAHTEGNATQSGVTAGETATILPKEAEDEFPSDDSECRAAANAGGDHVESIAERERDGISTSNTGEGAANIALPAKSSIRPLCRNPGETCGGYGRKHCRACEMAAAELEEVA